MSTDLLDRRDLLLQGEEYCPSVGDPSNNEDASTADTAAEPTIACKSRDFIREGNNDESNNIYTYYRETLLPAIVSSLPILYQQLVTDIRGLFHGLPQRIWSRIAPASLSLSWRNFMKEEAFLATDTTIWKQKEWFHGNFTQFLLRNFDTNSDGHISASELLHVNINVLPSYHQPQTWLRWFQCAWPLLDWKIGLFLWRTCGSFLFLIAVATIIPGRLHVLSGRILRWPVLALTYLMIAAELIVYVLVRLFIRLAEATFTTEKHRRLRADMEAAQSYDQWYGLAEQLDASQGRDVWRSTVDDDSAFLYNWAFIDELIADMKDAREKEDCSMVIAVLQQCTRKNVGGVMSEDLFSFTNTGETKDIVKNFLKEVEITLRWLTRSVALVAEEEEEEEERKDIAEKGDSQVNDHPKMIERGEVEKELLKGDEKVDCQTCKKDEKNMMGHALGLGSYVADLALHAVMGDHYQLTRSQPHPKSKQHQQMKKPITISKDAKEMSKNKEADKDSSTVIAQPSPIKTVPESRVIAQPSPIIDVSENLLERRREQVTMFLKRTRAAYGRTALCLSGGAMMGCYHFGHVKALLERGVLPHIISGTSAGSVVAATLCTRTNEEIERDMKPEILVDKLVVFSKSWPDRMRSVYENGTLFDMKEWHDLVKWFCCGDLTFEEAYQKTGRILNITLSVTTKKAPPVLVNYITAPCVTIASAILASAAVPGFIKPVLLQIKDANGNVRNQAQKKDQSYWDGSIDQDIPLNALAEMFNCQFFLAAQCNPHIVPFFHNTKGDVGRPSRWSRRMRQDSWRGGFLLAALELYLKSDMRAKFHFLNDLEAAVGFTSTMMTQVYGGTTTIVPQISIFDYFKLFSNPTLPFLKQCFQVGSIAAYRHCAMMKLHYGVSHAIVDCLATLEGKIEGSGLKTKSQMKKSLSSSHIQHYIS